MLKVSCEKRCLGEVIMARAPGESSAIGAGKGRPRSTVARQAIIDAFTESVRLQGYSKVSIDGLAKSAGVSRSTIYRWYKDKSEIALDAATDFSRLAVDDQLSGNFERDLHRFLEQTFAVGNELGTMYTVLMAEAVANENFANQVWEKYSIVRRNKLKLILAQQIEQPNRMSWDGVLDLVFGAIWYRMMSGHAPLDGVFATEIETAVKAILVD